MIWCAKIEFGLVEFFFVFGVDDALNDVFDGDQIVKNQKKIVFTDLLNGLIEKSSLFVKHLTICDDICLIYWAVVIFMFQLWQVLVDENFVVEGDGILIGFVTVDDDCELITVFAVYAIFIVVFLLFLHVSLKLSDTLVTFALELLLLLVDAFLLDILHAEKVDFGSAFDLQGKFSIKFRQVDHMVWLLWIQAHFYD